MVVGVVMRVASDLLPLGGDTAVFVSQRVAIWVAVEVHLSLLVAQRDGVVVVDANRLKSHHVVAQCLLELWGHEVVTWTRTGENGEVDLEPEEVQEEGDDDQSNDAGSEMLAEFRQSQGALAAFHVHEIPQVNCDWHTNGEEGEETDVFDGNDTAEVDTRQEQPLPPLAAEWLMAELVEANVREHGQCHEEDERSVEEDQTGLANVGVVEKHEPSCSDASWQRVSRLPHDHEDNGHGEGAERGGHSSVCDIGNLVGDV